MTEALSNIYIVGAFAMGMFVFATYQVHAYSGDFDRFFAAILLGAAWPIFALFALFVFAVFLLGDGYDD